MSDAPNRPLRFAAFVMNTTSHIQHGLWRHPDARQADFDDVTLGNNTTDPTVPGYSASTGWDPITGLGTPNAARLLPDLVSAAHAG